MIGWCFDLEMFKTLEHISYVVCPVEKVSPNFQVEELEDSGRHARSARNIQSHWIRAKSFYPDIKFSTLSIDQILGTDFESSMDVRMMLKVAERAGRNAERNRSRIIRGHTRLSSYIQTELLHAMLRLAMAMTIFIACCISHLRRGFQ